MRETELPNALDIFIALVTNEMRENNLRASLRLLCALACCVLDTGCATRNDSATAKTQNQSSSSVGTESAKIADVENGAANYKGVSFTYDAALASGVTARTVPAQPLLHETDKGDEVAPEHISFTFAGDYAASHKDAYFGAPEIVIYNIDEHKKAFALSSDTVKFLEEEYDGLKKALSSQPASYAGEVPSPYALSMNGSQTFRTHITYLKFKNGKGIVHLTQYDFERNLINNQGLTYIFEGLTDDGKYYVAAHFPVSASFLAATYDDTAPDGSSHNFFYGTDPEQNRRNYEKYLSDITRRLAATPKKDFTPDLTRFDRLLSSLDVRPQK